MKAVILPLVLAIVTTADVCAVLFTRHGNWSDLQITLLGLVSVLIVVGTGGLLIYTDTPKHRH